MRRLEVRVSLHGVRRALQLISAGGARHVIIDVDGCLTPGWQVVDAYGHKPFKVFGLDDRAAIEHWQHKFSVKLVTSDYSSATRARAQGWGVSLSHAPADAAGRLAVIRELTGNDVSRTIYIGDGYHDHNVFMNVGFGMAPRDAYTEALHHADAVIRRDGGRRAVAVALDWAGRWLATR